MNNIQCPYDNQIFHLPGEKITPGFQVVEPWEWNAYVHHECPYIQRRTEEEIERVQEYMLEEVIPESILDWTIVPISSCKFGEYQYHPGWDDKDIPSWDLECSNRKIKIQELEKELKRLKEWD